MHLLKNADGTFTIIDEPMRLEGVAADKFLDEVEHPDTSEARRKFLEECDRVYRKTQEKLDK
ncbi:MAG: hypothetical protein AUH83_11490 [Deltaproteobacteria bacterium 13_1_40CM_4_68_19]|nr:MAG: hypothetical protein AUH83_11490 [Deltaproteobacteria bacterium 13_1_40CM_4_68_19]